jgi:putative membrane protein
MVGAMQAGASILQTLAAEWRLILRHRRLAIAFVGVLFVPALYAFIYLKAMWDPAAHTRELPAALVNLDEGARYRERELNLGAQVIEAIEKHGQFHFRRYGDAAQARRDVRRGLLAFALELPADFSRRALPGEQPGAAKITIYTSEGNHYASAGFARRFAPEVAQRVNTMLGEARWELVLSTAAGSQRNLETLRSALADLQRGSSELAAGMAKAREGGAQLANGGSIAAESGQRLRGGAAQLSEGATQLTGGLRQLGPALRGLERGRPPEADLIALRGGARSLAEGQRELGSGLEALAAGSRKLEAGLGTLKTAADDIPIFGGSLVEGIVPLEAGSALLATGLEQAREGSARLLAGGQRLEEGVAALTDGTQRAGAALATLVARLPDDARLDSFVDGSRELVRGLDALGPGLRQLASGQAELQGGLNQLADGAGRLATGIELVRASLPSGIDAPGGSAQGLTISVEPVVEVVAPVPNNGSALTPNFVPLALWVGAVMAAFLVHWGRVPAPLGAAPVWAVAAAKLMLPLAAVLVQALLMLALLAGVLKIPLPTPGAFVLTLLTASATFLLLVFALVRLLGDLGRVIAVVLLVVQVSAAGALLPIELSDAAFQAIHPYLPLTWVVRAFRIGLFGAFEGELFAPLATLGAIGGVALLLGLLVGRWREVPPEQWRPPLDLD